MFFLGAGYYAYNRYVRCCTSVRSRGRRRERHACGCRKEDMCMPRKRCCG